MVDSGVACVSCELAEPRRRGDRPVWDDIASTDHWDLFHAMATAVEGWLILGLRRHAETIAELSDPESVELGGAVKDVSVALREAVGCAKTYVAQFAEHPDHRHVHVHVISRAPDLDSALVGPAIFSRLNVAEDEQLSQARKDEIGRAVRAVLLGPTTTARWHTR